MEHGTDNVEQLFKEPDIWGPQSTGHSVIWEGRLVPKMLAYDRGDEIELVLDGRLAFSFPRQVAFQALAFATDAMAIGAGWPSFGADKKVEAFAPQCFGISLDDVS